MTSSRWSRPRAAAAEPVWTPPPLGYGDQPARVVGWVQVFDVPPVAVRCTEYRTLARSCPGCRATTTALMPAAVPAGDSITGGTTYGPNLRAMAAYAGSSEVMGRARAAEVVAALTGAPVSTGFVSGCLDRLDAALTGAGFEVALKQALRAAAVLGTDESPVRLSTAGRQRAPNAHVFTVRTLRTATRITVPADAVAAGGGGVLTVPAQPVGDLIWCGAGATRASATIVSFAILPGYGGVLVRDDYGGVPQVRRAPAGTQQCVAHLRRYLADAAGMGPEQQQWTTRADAALCQAMAAVNAARAAGMTAPDAALAAVLADLRTEYDRASALGRSVNINATWPRGNHPALVLARRLDAKAEQVWLFSTRLASTALTIRSHGTVSKNFSMSRSITQSLFQHRDRQTPTASNAERPRR